MNSGKYQVGVDTVMVETTHFSWGECRNGDTCSKLAAVIFWGGLILFVALSIWLWKEKRNDKSNRS